MNQENNVLYLNVDKIVKDQDWSPILKSLKRNRDLKRITVLSDRQIIKGNGTRFETGTGTSIQRIMPDLVKF
jgi:hypothetical protein